MRLDGCSVTSSVSSLGRGEQAAGGARRLIDRGIFVARRALLLPARFDPAEIETEFRAGYAQLNAPQRRFGIFMALLVWIAFSIFDISNNPTGSTPTDIISVDLPTI